MPSTFFGRILAPPWDPYQLGIMPLHTLSSDPSKDPLLHIQPCQACDFLKAIPEDSINHDPLLCAPQPRELQRRAPDQSSVECALSLTWPTRQKEEFLMDRQTLSSFLKETCPGNDPVYQLLKEEISSHELSNKQLNERLVWQGKINKGLTQYNSRLNQRLRQVNDRLRQANQHLRQENARLSHDLARAYTELNHLRKESFQTRSASNPSADMRHPPMGFFLHKGGAPAAASLGSTL